MRTTRENRNLENRVLVCMPTGRDAALVCSALEGSGVFAEECPDSSDLKEKISEGAGAVLIADEALNDGALESIVKLFDYQPIWSDLPVLVFAGSGRKADKLLELIGARFNATIVERPIRMALLFSAIRSALRARQRQYQARDLLNQLEESDRQKDLFLATLSHELRTPLNSILGWIQLLRGNFQNGDKSIDLAHALEVIERNARTQSELISDVLFVSRVITGKLNLNFEPLDLVSVLETAIDTMRPLIEAKEIQLITRFDSGVTQIKGDPDRLQQVFWNLLSNAVKFTPPGGKIEISIKAKNSNIEIEIGDTGQGIEPKFLPYIFERFRQADNSFTRKTGGLGLGLAIARYLVELHGGMIRASSSGLNQGATFTVTIPVSAQLEEPKPFFETKAVRDERMQKQDDEVMPKKIRVLLVEDNDDSREMLKILLEQYGIETVAVDSAAEAFDVITHNPPDILISDVGLPDEDGYELIKKIRQLPPEKGGRIPAIALTGYVSLQDRAYALEVGYQEHLAKPLETDKLLELLKGFVSQKQPV